MRVNLNNISHDFAGTVILTGINGSIGPHDRIGIIGANGCGKTTLLNILTHRIEPVSGTVTQEPDTRIGFVPQQLDAGDEETLGDYLLRDILLARLRLRDLEEQMGTVDPTDESGLSRILLQYQHEREHYDGRAGDQAEDRAERLIAEVGLSATLDQPVGTLSGGERNVITLARAVIDMPNLLILDEPGNHLDFAGLDWLEDYLIRFPGAVCVVSHNRYLLDRVATSIWEIVGGRLTEYTGSYSDYRFAKLTQALSDQATYNVQQRALGRLEELVRTFEERARVTGDPKWGKRLNARRTQLAKAREQALAQPDLGEEKIEVAFARSGAKSDIAVDVLGYCKGFDELTLFTDASLSVRVGERVGIVGPNGSGKTTFLNDLIEQGDWENPGLRIGPSMQVGYCAQHRGRFPGSTTLVDAMLSAGNFTRNEIFNVLSRLLFEWGDLDRTVNSLSGGEWNRLQIAIAIIGKANLLILDEPTNHLDIISREAVEEALGEFNGTIITVSHDRYFLDAVTHRIEEIDHLKFTGFNGSFSEFWSSRGRSAARSRRSVSSSPGSEPGAIGSRGRMVKSSRSGSANGDGRRIELEIERLETEQLELEKRMARAFDQNDYRDGRKHGEELRKVRLRIDELYDSWDA